MLNQVPCRHSYDSAMEPAAPAASASPASGAGSASTGDCTDAPASPMKSSSSSAASATATAGDSDSGCPTPHSNSCSSLSALATSGTATASASASASTTSTPAGVHLRGSSAMEASPGASDETTTTTPTKRPSIPPPVPPHPKRCSQAKRWSAVEDCSTDGTCTPPANRPASRLASAQTAPSSAPASPPDVDAGARGGGSARGSLSVAPTAAASTSATAAAPTLPPKPNRSTVRPPVPPKPDMSRRKPRPSVVPSAFTATSPSDSSKCSPSSTPAPSLPIQEEPSQSLAVPSDAPPVATDGPVPCATTTQSVQPPTGSAAAAVVCPVPYGFQDPSPPLQVQHASGAGDRDRRDGEQSPPQHLLVPVTPPPAFVDRRDSHSASAAPTPEIAATTSHSGGSDATPPPPSTTGVARSSALLPAAPAGTQSPAAPAPASASDTSALNSSDVPVAEPPAPLAEDQLVGGGENETLDQLKMEMMERLQRQLSALLESRAEAEADVRANDELGARVRSLLAEKLAGNASAARDALERFDAYMNELDRVLRLHHRVSAQLERVNGSLNALREDASPAERSSLEAKRARLQTQLEDAKQLKEHNERRSEGLRALLQRSLADSDAREFDVFVNVKKTLLADLLAVEDHQAMLDDQLHELRRSVSCSSSAGGGSYSTGTLSRSLRSEWRKN